MRYVEQILASCLVASLVIGAQPSFAQPQGGGSVRLPENGASRDPANPEESGGGKFKTEKGITGAGGGEAQAKPEGGELTDDLIYLNIQDQELKDVIRQISKALSKNFIIDDKVKGKVTILSEKKMTKEEAYQAFLSALEVVGFTTVTGPGGLIKIVPLKEAIKSPIPIHVDTTPYTDSFVTRLIQLKNISALEISTVIKELISKEGNMFAYPKTNTLIITDSGTNIDRLMKIIKELDQGGPQEGLEIIPIHYADAKKIVANIQDLFEVGKVTAAGGGKGKAAEQQDIQEVRKIIADERTNSIIVYASKRGIEKIREVVAKLDSPVDIGDTSTVHVYYLKYAKAKEIVGTLTGVTQDVKSAVKQDAAKGGAPAGGDKQAVASSAGGTSMAQLDGVGSIRADETTNSLIIMASAKAYKMLLDELVSKLDVPRKQVYLEAIVMELAVSKDRNIGVSGYAGGGGNSFMGFGNTGGTLNNMIMNPSSMFGLPGLLGGLLSRDMVSVDVPKSGGGSTNISIPAFAAFLTLLQSNTQSNIVSTPNILTLDNQEASIEVTNTIYAKKMTTSGTTGFATTEPTPLESGLTLKITPQISEGDMVQMKIENKLSNFTAPPASDTGAAPQTKRAISTTVIAKDGQTVVLGGLMNDSGQTQKTKIPILGDIPIIGFFFRQTQTLGQKSNLLVFITPHILRNPTDFAEINEQKIGQRNKFIDQNFGKRQQREIRDAIAIHRADLLEFTMPIDGSGSSSNGGGSTSVSDGKSSSAQSSGGVITAPSVDSRNVPYSYNKSSVDSSKGGSSSEKPAAKGKKSSQNKSDSSGSGIDVAY